MTALFSSVTTKSGTLTVTPASATVTTGSAEKEYDGSPLTNSEASISGLVNGETADVTATGSITEVGSAENTYSISWNSAKSSNYTVSESLGILRVTAAQGAVTLTSASAEKVYDGTPLTDSSVTAEGLPSGFTVSATVSGSRTDVGSSENAIDSYRIYDADGKDVTALFSSVTTKSGTLKVTPKEVTVTTGSAERKYNGSPLTNSEASISGLANGETATVTASGSITDVGSAENTYSISWESAKSSNYTVTAQSGTLTVNPLPVEFDVGFRVEEEGEIEKEGEDEPEVVVDYDGYSYLSEIILASYEGVDEPVEPVEAVIDGELGTYSFTFTLPGDAKLQLNGTGYSDAGSYTIEPEITFLEGKKDNYEITFTNNKLTILPASLTITASASKEYDGEYLIGSNAVSIEGLADGDSITVNTTDISIKDAGTAENPYTIDWGDTNPDNYTVTQEPGILEVTPKEVTITTGSKEKVYDGETLFYNSYELSPSDPWVNGQAPIITVTGSRTIAGESDNTCNIEWKGVKKSNYNVTEKLGKLTVKPVEIYLESNCSYEYSGDIIVNAYDLIIEVKNVESESDSYYVDETEDNDWLITFVWGDKIDVSTLLTKDETSFAISPIHGIVSGDSGNYSFETKDQTGEFDIPPYVPIDGFGMGKSSTRRSIANSPSDESIREETSKEEPQEKLTEAPAPEDPQTEQVDISEPVEPQEEVEEAPETEEPHEEEEETPEPEEPQENEEETPDQEEPQEEVDEAAEPEEPQEEEEETPEPEEPQEDVTP